MAKCTTCGAPLPLKSTVCSYCQTRNDIDLKGMNHNHTGHDTNKMCPRCSKELITINLLEHNHFFIERCETCFGLFFDTGELENLLESSEKGAYEINHHALNAILEENHHADYPVMYLKCPVCQKLMNRVNYGTKSGVIVDKCSAHGIWLDSGELLHLREWIKSGGKILHQIKKEEDLQREYKKKLEIEKEMLKAKYMYGGSAPRKEDLSLSLDLIKIANFFFGK